MFLYATKHVPILLPSWCLDIKFDRAPHLAASFYTVVLKNEPWFLPKELMVTYLWHLGFSSSALLDLLEWDLWLRQFWQGRYRAIVMRFVLEGEAGRAFIIQIIYWPPADMIFPALGLWGLVLINGHHRAWVLSWLGVWNGVQTYLPYLIARHN